MNSTPVKLTQYSHGAGCGCKISPAVLHNILASASQQRGVFKSLLVGFDTSDDAAVMDLGDGTAIISTTDFFMPIVDDPVTFGKIAATNALSDVYAMGGKPLMAIAILGWPVNMLSADIAGQVISGAQQICHEAGIPLAGGHSIDSPEPLFGLAVTGRINVSDIKKNAGARAGDLLYLTKPLGTGILSTALKMERINEVDLEEMVRVMTQLNTVGQSLAAIEGVHAMTDVTGFGLAGHLIEMCKASGVSAVVNFERVPLMNADLAYYARMACVPAATARNIDSYGQLLDIPELFQRQVLCDPQTSGGLLISIDPGSQGEVESILEMERIPFKPIGHTVAATEIKVQVR
jgi:selenide,water dikinase